MATKLGFHPHPTQVLTDAETLAKAGVHGSALARVFARPSTEGSPSKARSSPGKAGDNPNKRVNRGCGSKSTEPAATPATPLTPGPWAPAAPPVPQSWLEPAAVVESRSPMPAEGPAVEAPAVPPATNIPAANIPAVDPLAANIPAAGKGPPSAAATASGIEGGPSRRFRYKRPWIKTDPYCVEGGLSDDEIRHALEEIMYETVTHRLGVEGCGAACSSNPTALQQAPPTPGEEGSRSGVQDPAALRDDRHQERSPGVQESRTQGSKAL